ncbi:DUF86 domain-containing protein [Pullulanibacillus pueri]|uniref:UPF0331 protein YutE n=1 Tax=Pullulanibacillus pueri TaxID=1437324 RepID=A0A8J2ZSL4_9BACL|nr:DUF86 domain-containing protein [Pullulanibacillus pueri]GGH75148.1 UPF0331 protein YutE [Pullulanibacillus pueri]
MYFVDRQRIESILTYMTEQFELLKTKKSWDSKLEQLALERLIHVTIESFLDIGNQVIDGFIMRDPGSYEDIVDILVDEKVVPKGNHEAFKLLVQQRKGLVQYYDQVDIAALLTLMETHLEAWSHFPHQVRQFLQQELGPVSAFKPENETD